MNEELIKNLSEIRDTLKKMQPKETTALDERFMRKTRREA